MTRALIVADVQNDFCEGGSLAVKGGAEVAFALGNVLHAWQEADERDKAYSHVVAVRDHHIDPGNHFSDHPDYRDTWPVHCIAGTDGAAFHPNLDPQPFGAVFDKGEHTAAYSGFEGKTGDGTSLADWLRTHGITEVDVAGIATDHCVRATALDAVRLGFATRVLLSLTAGVAGSTTEDAIRAMRAAGCELVGVPIVREEGPPPVTL
ncbi:isochorismatase family protein [Actinopolymorpha pittospori]|uniref:nicotinamidase n=1 Tax=Actinopolymorpha pittospori TaxID=648752 RepID=A0A927N2Y9_9ACTN|nr:isochorismatase family protein [Actinopolymorpha pittospori]MBE1607977.1 nicotinamidase/pyrazinamidase [Actinopolymorpha pittospori]